MNIPVHYVDGQATKTKLGFPDVVLIIVLLCVGTIAGAYLALQVIGKWVSFNAPQALYNASQQPSDVKPLDNSSRTSAGGLSGSTPVQPSYGDVQANRAN